MADYTEPKTVIDTNTYQLLADFGQDVAQSCCQNCGRSTDRLHITETAMPRTICERCRPVPKGQRFVPGAQPLHIWLAIMLLPAAKEEFLGKWRSWLVTPSE